MEQYYPFLMEPLGYRYNDLEPYLDLQTILLHYSVQQGGADRLNAALGRWPCYQTWSLTQLLTGLDRLPRELRTQVRRYGGKLYNHQIYFSSMNIPTGQQPDVGLAAAIQKCFGSLEGLRQRFAEAAQELPGVGWIWLVTDRRGQLRVVATRDDETPLCQGAIPLFCCDLWEHAYYLQYKNRRDRYMEAWWNLVDWQTIGERYRQRNLPLEKGSAPKIYG